MMYGQSPFMNMAPMQNQPDVGQQGMNILQQVLKMRGQSNPANPGGANLPGASGPNSAPAPNGANTTGPMPGMNNLPSFLQNGLLGKLAGMFNNGGGGLFGGGGIGAPGGMANMGGGSSTIPNLGALARMW